MSFLPPLVKSPVCLEVEHDLMLVHNYNDDIVRHGYKLNGLYRRSQ